MAKEHPRSLVPLSTVIRCFRDSRALRLRVNSIEDIIDVGEDAEGKPQAQGYARTSKSSSWKDSTSI
jgi:hypothetical protein